VKGAVVMAQVVEHLLVKNTTHSVQTTVSPKKAKPSEKIKRLRRDVVGIKMESHQV
jgi:hypothetical protein